MTTFALLVGLLAATPADARTSVNDWSCRTGEAHPVPVVLVHGTSDNKESTWRELGPMLASRGYCVFSLTYGVLPGASTGPDAVGGLTRIEDSSRELATFTGKVLRATGRPKADIVGYSQGTLLPTYYAKFLGGRTKINRYVSLAPLWNGTDVALAADLVGLLRLLGLDGLTRLLTNCAACTQVLTGSPLLERLRADGIRVPGIRYTNIVTTHDRNIVPYTSGLLNGPDVTNVVLQDTCAADESEHGSLVVDPNALGHVLNALDPARARPVPCRPTGPDGLIR
ncbi:esterase/lipase family protein [Amycolatopsis sp. H20-H5]|uniref:esterase/lipase family protein n=1 Tax=Amycolatopsis sp. H20-H5 TaxID=3046309 RepID=UPI002DBE04F0|nr:alpha/beta fold hydrolase [Amycolatopsis sp. H20-H5]MEC3975043.1 alpha/beta fold hydrolase [Amycolatopsis sp. H20-H5]